MFKDPETTTLDVLSTAQNDAASQACQGQRIRASITGISCPFLMPVCRLSTRYPRQWLMQESAPFLLV